MSETPEVPVLDIRAYLAQEPGAQRQLAVQIKHALCDVGFMVLEGHDVDPDTINNAFAAAADFHALQPETKASLRMNEHNNGYMGSGQYAIVTSEHNETNAAERNESFFYKRERASDDPQVKPGRRFVGPNQWPQLRQFKDRALAYADAMDDLAMRLLPAMSEALDLPEDYFTQRFTPSQFSVRFAHYPRYEGDDDAIGIAPHSDSNFLTFLPQSELPGLQVKAQDGRWIDLPRVKGSIAVNSGDILRRWTNGRFKSTPHRALAPKDKSRFAIPFFFGPSVDTIIECLPTCTSLAHPPAWSPITYEQWQHYWYDTNYNHNKQS